MAIEFHCNFCGKLVRAPEEAGGKKGKCPTCQNILYIPMPEGQVEELDLAPVDEEEERRKRQMEEQARAAERALLKEKNPAPEGAASRSADSALPPNPMSADPNAGTVETNEDVEFLIIEWIRSMADGDLGDADRSMMMLQKHKALAKPLVAKLQVAEPPPDLLKDVPRPVLNRYFRMLRDQL